MWPSDCCGCCGRERRLIEYRAFRHQVGGSSKKIELYISEKYISIQCEFYASNYPEISPVSYSYDSVLCYVSGY